jgi:hypothetical protein
LPPALRAPPPARALAYSFSISRSLAVAGTSSCAAMEVALARAASRRTCGGRLVGCVCAQGQRRGVCSRGGRCGGRHAWHTHASSEFGGGGVQADAITRAHAHAHPNARTCRRLRLRALASATFLMGRASMAARRAFSASISSFVTCVTAL